MKTARDVTIVVLIANEGQAMQRRCLNALEAQILRPGKRILVQGQSPFRRAFEAGLAQVDTPLVLQCDVDMVLDPDCLAVLYGTMQPVSAMSLGYLDDAMTGPLHGIKLFRVSALRTHPLPAGVTGETQQIEAFLAAGYELVEARRSRPAYGHAPEVLGRHSPNYDDLTYLCGRFRRLGEKTRQRRAYSNIASHLDKLARGRHPHRHLAMLAFAEGLLSEQATQEHDKIMDSRVLEVFTQLQETRLDARFPMTRRVYESPT